MCRVSGGVCRAETRNPKHEKRKNRPYITSIYQMFGRFFYWNFFQFKICFTFALRKSTQHTNFFTQSFFLNFMSNIPTKIDRVLQEGYEFRFGDYISKGFDLVNKNLGGFIGYGLVYLLISLVVAMIPVLGQIAGLIIGPALLAGFYHVANQVDRGEQTVFGDFFKGFDKLGNLFLTSLLTGLIVVVAAIPGLIVLFTSGLSLTSFMTDEPEINMSMIIVGVLLMLIPLMYLAVSYLFAPMLVWFYDLKPWDAMETSRKLVGKNWGIIFGFALVMGIIASLGVVLLGVGLLYTMPAYICANYAAFADITRLNEDDESNSADLIDHFVPQS